MTALVMIAAFVIGMLSMFPILDRWGFRGALLLMGGEVLLLAVLFAAVLVLA